MTKNSARVLLVLVCLLAAAAVGLSVHFNQTRQYEQARLLTIERETGALLTSLAELRAAQMAYLATGQGPEFWMRRVTDLTAYLESGIARLRDTTVGASARSSLDAAANSLHDMVQLDGRARSAVQSDQLFLASDIVFADGVTGAQLLSESLAAARNAERASIEATLQRDAYIQLALMPAALLLVLLAAYSAGRQQSRPPARSAAEEMAQMIRELPPPVKAPTAAQPQPAPATASAPKPVAPASTINWTETADLCVDLARVTDASALAALLRRAAKAIDATGVVLWVVDVPGRTLAPVLTHGYSDRVVAKIGTLDVAADNVTSLAFRSVRPQSLPGTGKEGAASALAVPLVTTGGCTGVLAAEVPGAKPADESVAVARILAAQMATMLSPIDKSVEPAADGDDLSSASATPIRTALSR